MPDTVIAQTKYDYTADELDHAVEADSQTFAINSILKRNSDGKLAIIVAAGSNVDSTGDDLYGVARRAGKNTTGNTARDLPFLRITDKTLLPLRFYATAGADAEYRDIVKGQVGVLRNEGGVFVFNSSVTANPVLVVERLEANQPATEKYTIVWCRVLTAARYQP